MQKLLRGFARRIVRIVTSPILTGRAAWWRAQRVMLCFVQYFRTAWRPLVVGMGGAWVAIFVAPHIHRPGTGQPYISTAAALATVGLIALTVLAFDARRRTVFEEFGDATSTEPKAIVAGLGALLAAEVTQLTDLYRSLDEVRDEEQRGAGKPLEPVVLLDDVVEVVRTAVSSDTKVSLGPVEVPVGAILTLLARFFRGPRVGGTLHDEGGRLVLVARWSGRHSRTWIVEEEPFGTRSASSGALYQVSPSSSEDPAVGSGSKTLDVASERAARLVKLNRALAYRIFADLSLDGSVRPAAAALFTDAVRLTVLSSQTPGSRSLQWPAVERALSAAVAEDSDFDLAWYNLAVVSTRMDRVDEARATFAKAFEINPRRWDAAYGLATLAGDSATRLLLCRHIAVSARDPAIRTRALDLEGYLHASAGDNAGARKARRVAVRRGWRALGVAERRAAWLPDLPGTRTKVVRRRRLLSACLTNLAQTYADESQAQLQKSNTATRRRRRRQRAAARRALRRAETLLRQAQRLLHSAGKADLHDALVSAHLADVFLQLGRRSRAAEEMEVALRLAPSEPAHWVRRLRALHGCSGIAPSVVQREARSLFALAPLVSPTALADVHTDRDNTTLTDIVAALTECDQTDLAARIALWPAWLQWLSDLRVRLHNEDPGAWWQAADVLSTLLAIDADPKPAWELVHCSLTVLDAAIEHGYSFGRDTLDMFLRAGRHAAVVHEVWCADAGIITDLAQLLRALDVLPDAFRLATTAVRAQPFRTREWAVLGDVLETMNDLDGAKAAYDRGVAWAADPHERARMAWAIAALKINRIADVRDRSIWAEELSEARRQLDAVLELLEPADIDEQMLTRYWRGIVLATLGRREAAIADLQVAAAYIPMRGDPLQRQSRRLVALLALARTELETLLYDSSARNFRAAHRGVQALRSRLPLNGRCSKEFGSELQQPTTLCSALVVALCGQAECLLRRGVDHERVQRLLSQARRHVAHTPRGDSRHAMEAQLEQLQGLLSYRRGRSSDAIIHLTRALDHMDTADVYIDLAEVSADVMETSDNELRRRTLHRGVLNLIRRAEEVDLRGDLTDRASALQRRADMIVESAQ